MTRLLIEDVDADCDDDLNNEKDQCPQPVPHDVHSLLSAGATGYLLLLNSLLSRKRAKAKAATKRGDQRLLGTGIKRCVLSRGVYTRQTFLTDH
jgi:hypothetical protein